MVDDAGRLWRRLRVWLRWRRHDAELQEEIAHHFELKRRALEARGLSPAAADAAAHRAMGNVTVMRESSRQVWLMGWLEGVWQDITYGLRSMRRQPLFTGAAVLGLAGGLGFSAAAFSGWSAFATRGWDVREPARLVWLFATSKALNQNRATMGFSLDEIRAFSERARSVDGVFAFVRARPDGSGDITAAPVSANYFDVLGVRMSRGRGFLPEEDRVGAPRLVIVVSHDYWRTQLAGALTVIGSPIKVRGVSFTVVGVAAPKFAGTDVIQVDAWIPLAAMPVVRPKDRLSRTSLVHSDQCCLGIAARLAPGVHQRTAASELTGLVAQATRTGNDTLPRSVVALPFTVISSAGPQAMDEVGPVFLLIAGGVLAVLLLACANVANLLLARATSRQREISIRLALGASRSRLIRQLMTESLLLALLAGFPAMAIAAWMPRWVVRIMTPWPITMQFIPDGRVVLFTLGLSIVSCVLFGLAPALQATRPPSAQRVRLPLRSVFLSAQVVFCVVLLVSAGLFLRSARTGRDLDMGFATEDVTELTLTVPANEDEAARSARLAAELPELAAASGVQRVAYTQTSPFRNLGVAFRLIGQSDAQHVSVASVSPEYFAVVGLPLVSGRVFASGPAGANEILVNASLAERLGGARHALGLSLIVDSVPRTIVGIVRTARDVGLRRVDGMMYRLLDWTVAPRVVVRGESADARRLAAAISARDPSLGVASRDYAWYVRDALSTANGAAAMAGALGVLALVLASVGMFGVFSYWVRQRQHDIGVRMALGATPRSIVRMVLRASARAVGWGLAIGVVVAAAAAQLLRGSLYGLSPLDPIAFALAIGILAGTALVATLLPAWRAVQVNPLESLRAD